MANPLSKCIRVPTLWALRFSSNLNLDTETLRNIWFVSGPSTVGCHEKLTLTADKSLDPDDPKNKKEAEGDFLWECLNADETPVIIRNGTTYSRLSLNKGKKIVMYVAEHLECDTR